MSTQFSLVTILGPTAVGKTTFAAHLAVMLDAEIISADSRQVYRQMDIGTGKDLSDYTIDGRIVPFHLIDIAEPGSEYNMFQFQRDFESSWSGIISRGKTPVLCGGTGMYLESVLKGYNLSEVPVDKDLRQEFLKFPDEELVIRLQQFRPLHNTTDILDRERLIRAIEIENHKSLNFDADKATRFTNTPVFGLRFERTVVRQRITARLVQRLENGMIDEVKQLLDRGINAERLKYYGLEYKYITMFLEGEITYNTMFSLLNTAIHQFAKRQMTWFRRMEKNGSRICWLEGEDGLASNLEKAKKYLNLQ